MTFEKTHIIGTSPDSFEDAVDDAIDRAEETYEDLMWAEIEEFGVEIATAPDREYQAEVTVAYQG